jgi:hypothetical protein
VSQFVEGQSVMPLPQAGARLGMSWGQAYNALLLGQLEGKQVGSRWFVTTASVERLARHRERRAQEERPVR